MTTTTAVQPSPVAGYVGFALGALSLLLVLTHFWSGPFAPQQRTGVTVGELAAEIRHAAVRKLKGQPPPKPTARPWDIDRDSRSCCRVSCRTCRGCRRRRLRTPRRLAASDGGSDARRQCGRIPILRVGDPRYRLRDHHRGGRAQYRRHSPELGWRGRRRSRPSGVPGDTSFADHDPAQVVRLIVRGRVLRPKHTS